MPVLRFNTEKLTRQTGLSVEELIEALFKLKCESEIVDDTLEVEVNPDRPDLYISEGLARAVNALNGRRRGWSLPRTEATNYTLKVDPPETRPYIAAAIVYNVNVDEDYLEELIQFQEKLHDTIGRRRRKVAIGLHDLEKLPSNKLYYKMASLNEKMTPLDESEEYTISRVLEETQQGRKYGRISLNVERGVHPALYSGDEIIALPPVINSNITRIEPGTRSLFIDVTGTHKETVEKVLDIIVTALAERPGAYIGKVLVEDPHSHWWTPKLSGKRMELSREEVSGTLGVTLSLDSIIDALERTLHNARKESEDSVIVEVAPFRVDILRNIDLIEDIAIALGYESLGYNKPIVEGPGKLLTETRISRVVRDLAIGLGFTEVTQLTLTSPKLLDATGFKDRVEVLNPVQYEYSVLRPSLIPSLLSVAAGNLHAKKPVKAFEIGVVVEPGLPPRDRMRMGLMIMDDEVGYEDIQAAVYSILRILDVEFTVEPYSHPVFIEGRSARIILPGMGAAGVLGEVSPEVLQRLEISFPVAVAELDLEVLSEWWRSKTSSLS